MKILVSLTYYRPHTSGLTIYCERLAKALVQRGHTVTILTSRFSKILKKQEHVSGVNIVRVPVWCKISKGVIMPTIGYHATKLVLSHDVIHLHLPQFDAAGIIFRGKLFSKPTILTYHCDLKLPLGILNGTVHSILGMVNSLAARWTDAIVTNTKDYADHSRFLQRFKSKLHFIPPPIEVVMVEQPSINSFKENINPSNRHPIIGMVTRFAAEKGVEVLLKAFPKIQEVYPNAMILFVGQYNDVIGEKKYLNRLMPYIRTLEVAGQWKFLGLLNEENLSAFYSMIDVLVVPSLNSTESFGMVQIEAMLHGTPVVASNIPGVRFAIQKHGMGCVATVNDPDNLSRAILDSIGKKRKEFLRVPAIQAEYSSQVIAEKYERLFLSLINKDKLDRFPNDRP